MRTILHKSENRGRTQLGWLDSYHSFSFGNFYHPDLTGFGLLRVLNDDKVSPGAGFATHPHRNMEIISIPLSGALKHRDSTGKEAVIKEGDVQIMSAGSGLHHSEKNAASDRPVEFLQIWILPEAPDLTPGYDQQSFTVEKRMNKLQTVVDPEGKEGVQINQKAWLYLGKYNRDAQLNYKLRNAENGVYIFVLEGGVSINSEDLKRRDGLGAVGVSELDISISKDSELLLIEVPMDQ
nr:pirin family protein [Saprospiraceae bacterium]